MAEPRIAEGDFVFINGSGTHRIIQVRADVKVRVGRSGAVSTASLVGLRYGEVVRLDHKGLRFVPTDEYPDLDISELNTQDELRDNRNLLDDNSSQQLSNVEVATIRKEKGPGELIATLVEKSSTFQGKTTFAQEKYVRKKRNKFGTLFKVEKVTPDILAEVQVPTAHPSSDAVEDTRWMRIRADTLALILHHSNVHHGSRVLVYEKTNGVLEAALMARIGDTGRIFQLLDQSAQPNTYTARMMQLPHLKENWKAVPRNQDFLTGVRTERETPQEEKVMTTDRKRFGNNGCAEAGGVSQWIKGVEAREQLLAEPASSLIVADDENPKAALADMFPFLAYGGHIVIYTTFLDELGDLFRCLRNDSVNICVSETCYRQHQVLPQRTHPSVTMSTAGGYLLTAIKAQRNPNPRQLFSGCSLLEADTVGHQAGCKRSREADDTDQKSSEALA